VAEARSSEPSSLSTLPDSQRRIDAAILAALGLTLALSVRGLSPKPHADFYGIWETGDALIHGELPASFKRAPVYPVLVALGGELLRLCGVREVPAQRAAEWINTLLLPVNMVLTCLLGWRWIGAAARWAAWWFGLLPIGLYCTTNLLVEPLLITTILLTLIAAARASSWAYAAAALATMTRYDAAGLLAGLLLADVLARRPLRRTLLLMAAAAVPLAVWLILTAATWNTRSAGHYLIEMVERPTFNPLPAVSVTHAVCLDIDRFRFPYVLQDVEPFLRYAVHAGLIAAALFGLVIGLRTARGTIPLVTLSAGYILVHAIFPFHFDRFGYPLAPGYLLLASAGLEGARARLGVPSGLRRTTDGLMLVLVVVSSLAIVGELRSFRFLTASKYVWAQPLPALALLATALLWGSANAAGHRTLRRVAALLALCAIGLAHIRNAVPRVAGGDEMENVVAAARWVRDYVPAGQRVLSPVSGLLRLYAGRHPADRFPAFEDISAGTWPDILAECRSRNIHYIIWYEGLFGELGDYYVRRCRLERFTALSQPESVGGVDVAAYYPEHPPLWILRVLRQDEAQAP